MLISRPIHSDNSTRLTNTIARQLNNIHILQGEEILWEIKKMNDQGMYITIASNHLEAKNWMGKLWAPLDHAMINKLCKEHGLASTIPLAKGNFFSVYKPLLQNVLWIREITHSIERLLFSTLLYTVLYPSIVTYKNVDQSISITKEKNGEETTKIRLKTQRKAAERNSKKTLRSFQWVKNKQCNLVIYPYGDSYNNLEQDFLDDQWDSISQISPIKTTFASPRLGNRPILPLYICEGEIGEFYIWIGKIISVIDESGQHRIRRPDIVNTYMQSMQDLKNQAVQYLSENNLITTVDTQKKRIIEVLL